MVSATYDLRGRKILRPIPISAPGPTLTTRSTSSQPNRRQGPDTTFTYDQLGRTMQRVEPDMTCAWVYDTAPMGIGKPPPPAHAGPTAGYQRNYSYD